MKCDTCKFQSSDFGVPWPEFRCIKGHWDMPDLGDTTDEDDKVWDDCNDYESAKHNEEQE